MIWNNPRSLLKGVSKKEVVFLSNQEALTLGVDRYAKSRALRALEGAGLIRVEHRRGRIPW
jgi:hypothetical protein